MIGEVLRGYKILRKLGEGGTGETYLAEHEQTGQKAAAKVLFKPMSADTMLLAGFFAAVKAAGQVNHVGIVDLYDCGVHDGRAFVLYQYLEGKTLTDALIELGSVSDMESFADIAWQLATLLAAVHGSKLVHGGLKPDGIFLTFPPSHAPRPLVKLLDFGMARFSLNVRHSQTGSLLGAPLYMSPESARGLGNADHRADIYSLGCILFEMACGRPPFVREGKGELIIAHATEVPPSVSSLEPSIPPAIDTLIGRMLTKNPATRPQSMAEVASVLEKFFKCPSPTAGQVAQVNSGKAAPIPLAPGLPSPGPAIPATSNPLPIASPSSLSQPAVRHQEATALLPPSSPLSDCPTGSGPSSRQTWLSRVQYHTAILAPSSAGNRPALLEATQFDQSSSEYKPPPGQRASRATPASPINMPIVVATAAAVIFAGIGTYLLLREKPAGPGLPTPGSVSARPTTSRAGALIPDGFRLAPTPPPASPDHAMPREAVAKPLPREESRPSAETQPPSKAAGKRPARRW